MSAFRAARVGDHAKHGFLLEGRDGAGDESTGRNVAGDGEEDHVVAGGGVPRRRPRSARRGQHSVQLPYFGKTRISKTGNANQKKAQTAPSASSKKTARNKEEDAKWMRWVEMQYPKPKPPATQSAAVTPSGSAVVSPASPAKKPPTPTTSTERIRQKIDDLVREEFFPGMPDSMRQKK